MVYNPYEENYEPDEVDINYEGLNSAVEEFSESLIDEGDNEEEEDTTVSSPQTQPPTNQEEEN